MKENDNIIKEQACISSIKTDTPAESVEKKARGDFQQFHEEVLAGGREPIWIVHDGPVVYEVKGSFQDAISQRQKHYDEHMKKHNQSGRVDL